MVSRFNITGSILQIDYPEDSKQSNGIRNCVVYDQVEEDVFPVTLQGNILALIEDGKVRENDIVYIEGKLRKDRILLLAPNKIVTFLQGTFLNIIVPSSSTD